MLIKPIALILIMLYLVLPTMCYADPCDLFVCSSSDSIELSAGQQQIDGPPATDDDRCETSGYLPMTALTVIPS
jgi:hypothetical protein